VTTVDGLYFVGLPWLYTWGSGRFSGVATDAAYLADQIVGCLGKPQVSRSAALNELALGS
jgi:putative flavoprotein involved in K+ transport